MGKITGWLKKNLAKGASPASSKITVLHRTDEGAPQTRPSNGGRITIRGVNSANPTTPGGVRDVPVENPDLSGGIRVARRRKPGTCPMCRSKGTVEDNPASRPKWKCSVCEHVFD